MKEPRTAKRRRVSDSTGMDRDGDTTMQDVATPLQTQETPNAAGTDTANGSNGDANTDTRTDATPSRAGLRSSGRQRKAPQRYEDEVIHIRSVRKSRSMPGKEKDAVTSTSTSTAVTTENFTQSGSRNARQQPHRSLQRSVSEAGTDNKDEEEDEEDEEEDEDEDEDVDDESVSPEPKTRRPTRTRSKRTAVRFTDTRADELKDGDKNGDADGESPDDFPDALDDLVNMQLQNGIAQGHLSGQDEAMGEEPLPAYAEHFQQFVRNGHTKEMQLLTKTVVEKLNGKRLVPLKGLDPEYQKVHQLIEQTVTFGEGNSMLLLGSRGAGKTAIIESIVSSLKQEHKNDFHVVRLNGFLHTDDRLALREIWRQLGRETNTEEEAGKVTSYADTMATLLALLSHPEELQASADNQNGTTTAKSIVIVLDEFDLFVTHPRQTLLYNLFDIAQARKAPLAVLGVTTKVDVTEMLEKRVKSRFSHRSVYVPLPRTFEVFSDACLGGLDLEESEFASADDLSDAKSDSWMMALDGWRAYLQGLWADPAFQTHLRRIYHTTKSVGEFFMSALIPLTELHHSLATSPIIPTPSTFSTHALSCPDPAPLPFLPSLSTSPSSAPSSLPLSLLLAATRLTALYDPGSAETAAQDLAPLALSFPAAYAEYVRLLTSAKTSASVSGASVTPGRVWGRDVAREAWERLVAWGLVSPVGGGSGTADGRMFRVEISFEEVVGLVGKGGSLGRWWRDA
ncbi:origin recognition complex subunit 4 C-terminus-domain-containing protein [Aspergillus tetrazonus]